MVYRNIMTPDEELMIEAVKQHKLALDAKTQVKISWFKLGKVLSQLRKNGLWKKLVSKYDGWGTYIKTLGGVSLYRANRLIRWNDIAEQCNIIDEDYEGISENKILEDLIWSVKYKFDGKTVATIEEIRNLFFASKYILGKEYGKACITEKYKKSDGCENKFEPTPFLQKGFVYNGHGEVIGSLIKIAPNFESHVLDIRIQNHKFPKSGPIIIVIPEELRLRK